MRVGTGWSLTSGRVAKPAAVVATLSLLGSLLAVGAAEADWDRQPLGADVVEQDHLCSKKDRPEEPGQLQGDVPAAHQESGRARQGYNCGLSLVGQTLIERVSEDGEQQNGNANMAWAGDCAYISGPGVLFGEPPAEVPSENGVAVVDVSDPANPVHVRTLRTPGAAFSSEAIHAVQTPDRAVLVVGEYGNVGKTDVPMDIYDVSDCADPVLLQTFEWPENTHNLTISGNGRYVFGTQPLQVLDIDPLFDDSPGTEARFLGNLEKEVPIPLVATGPGADLDDPLPTEVREVRKSGDVSSVAHEAWPSHDASTLYIGGVTAQFEALTIVDLSAWLARDADNVPAGPPRVISQRSGRGHSVRTASVDDDGEQRRLLIHSEEGVFGLAKGCFPETLNPFAGPAQPHITDITDPAAPAPVTQFGLEINQPENCPAQLDSGVDASTHYHTVDREDRTNFVMASMWNAGLRVFDVRDPERPVEVAYFNPGDVSADPDTVLLDQAWGHARYVPETGHIWFATAAGGFWVVELAPQVRKHFRQAPARGGQHHPAGRPGTVGAARPDPRLRVDVTPYYCTLG